MTMADGTTTDVPDGYEIFLNSRYQVWVRYQDPQPGWPAMAWLSIKRHDRGPMHDWREFQTIKNELIGPENEAVELYPAESRLNDSANQYHLWVVLDPKFRFPFGYTDRVVGNSEPAAKVVNRPFEAHTKPAELK